MELADSDRASSSGLPMLGAPSQGGLADGRGCGEGGRRRLREADGGAGLCLQGDGVVPDLAAVKRTRLLQSLRASLVFQSYLDLTARC